MKMLNLSHKNLDVWQKGLVLVKSVYKITDDLPNNEQFVLSSQMRRAVNSILFNISEGLSRHTKIEKIRFLDIAHSSLVELDTQFEVCKELEYFSSEELSEIAEQMNSVFAMLTNLIRKLRRDDEK